MFTIVDGLVVNLRTYSTGVMVYAKYIVGNSEYYTQRFIEGQGLHIGNTVPISVNPICPWDACIVLEGEG